MCFCWIVCLCLAVTFSIPPRKKVMGILTGVGENHRSEPSADHISMRSKGIKSPGKAGHPENRNIMAAIKDLHLS